MPSVLLLVLAGLARPGEVVASVGAKTITAEALASRVAWSRAHGGRATAAEVLEAFIDDTLLADEARRQGLAADPEVRSQVEAQRRRLAAQRLLAMEVYPSAAPDEAVLRSLYHANADSARLRLLLFASREAAQASLDRLRAGAGFAAEARGSLDPSEKRQGDTVSRTRSQLDPALAEAVFAAPVGSIVGPVPLQLGFAVAQVLERSVGGEPGFQAKRESIRRFAESQLREQVRLHYQRQLRSASKAALDEPFLASTGARLDASAAEADHVVAAAGGRALRYGEVLSEVRRVVSAQGGSHAAGPQLKLRVASGLLDEMLLEEEAMKRGHGGAPEVEAALREVEWEAMIRLLASRIRRAEPAPSQAEVEVWYRDHRGDFQDPAPLPFEKVREAAAERVREERGLAAVRRHLAALRAGARIAVDRAALERAAQALDRDTTQGKPTDP